VLTPNRAPQALARTYDAANLKRKLLIGIREFEVRRFLEPLSESERLRKVRSGDWSVLFERARPEKGVQPKNEIGQDSKLLVQAFTERGVTSSTARQTVAD
jgi:hypothetical protein